MPPVRIKPLSRRAVLLGGASMALLGACGDDKKKASSNDPSQLNRDGTKYSLVTFTDTANSVEAGSPQRVTFGLGDAQGALVDDGPSRLVFEVLSDDRIVEHINSSLHRQGLGRGYFPLTFTPPKPGYYTARTKVAGHQLEASFQVVRTVAIPRPGQPMVVADTPTVTNHRGVSPICSKKPACPLHEVNLRDALASGKPVALLVATPAFCQTAICGPVLDVLLSQHRTFGDQIEMIHAEVYADGQVAATDIAKATLAPLLRAYHLPFEPVLFLSRKDGTIVRRLDTIFDVAELRDALRSVVAS